MSALHEKFLETGSPVPKIAAYSAAERKDGRVPTLCFRTKPYIFLPCFSWSLYRVPEGIITYNRLACYQARIGDFQ